jgi:hypothetical protein
MTERDIRHPHLFEIAWEVANKGTLSGKHTEQQLAASTP